MFEARLTRPEPGNRYYITRARGGYSTAIRGLPADPDCDVLANCVGYAVGRFHEIAKRTEFDLLDPVNAEELFENAKRHGLRTGSTPQHGALMIWAKGEPGDRSDGAGHAAVVEQICGDGSLLTSESGWGASKPFWTVHRTQTGGEWQNGDGYRFLGFVYPPKWCPYRLPMRAVRRGDSGESVKWVQYFLIAGGYLRETELDGDFGRITLGAVLAFQFEHGLQVDGIVGPETRAALADQ